jgi:hypothetical protein
MAAWKLTLSLLPETFAVCRLEPDAAIPGWAMQSSFFSITRTPEEISIVCPQDDVSNSVLVEKDWRCFKVEGPLDFRFTGVLASLASPLAAAGVSIFALATYNTDYLLIKEEDMSRAVLALTDEGHQMLP